MGHCMKALVILGIIAALLFVQIPVAAVTDFTISFDTPDNFLVNKTDSAILHINNNGTTDYFGITVLSMESWVRPSTSRIQVPAGTVKDVNISVSPPISTEPSFFTAVVTVTRESTNAKMESQLLLQVRQIVDATISNFTASCTDCTDRIDFSMDILNVGTEPFVGTLTATVGEVPRNYSVSIDLGGSKHFSDTFDLTGIQPGNYTLAVVLTANNRQVTKLANYQFQIPVV